MVSSVNNGSTFSTLNSQAEQEQTNTQTPSPEPNFSVPHHQPQIVNQQALQLFEDSTIPMDVDDDDEIEPMDVVSNEAINEQDDDPDSHLPMILD